MSKKVTLGYASRTEAVLALQGQGLSNLAIAARIGIEPTTVSALACSAARTKRAIRPTEAFGRNIVFPLDVLDELRPHAAKRGMHVNKLVRIIVEQVVDAKLVDAVLDDLEHVGEWA